MRARLYYNLFPARCSYEFALVVRTSSRVVRTLFVRVRVRCSRVVRTLFVRCSYERELTRELRDAPVCSTRGCLEEMAGHLPEKHGDGIKAVEVYTHQTRSISL